MTEPTHGARGTHGPAGAPGAGEDDDLDVFSFVEHEELDPDGAAQDGAEDGASAGASAAGSAWAEARRSPAPRGPALRTLIVLGVVALGVVAVTVMVLQGLLAGPDHAEASGEEITFTVQPGEGLDSVADRLDSKGIVGSASAVRRAAEEHPGTLQPGEYLMRERMPAAEVVAMLQGTSAGAAHYVVVNRGQRLAEVLDPLAEATGLHRSALEAAAQNPAEFGVPEASPSLEGWLDPGEYRLPVSADAEEVLRTLVQPRLDYLVERGVTDPDEQHRVVTIASILEAEALPRDYARVAGVIENRLAPDNDETKGLLQVDSAVTYGLGTRSLQFSSSQRADESNPYNTYQHPGLPPGPLGMPSDGAVDAALNPVESDDYYWVTTDIATGHTEFSRTYEEHLEHVREFQKYCATNPDVC